MAQPKDPPISYRPGADRAAKMAAYAEKHKLGQAQMLHNFIDDGLAADGPKPRRQAAPVPKPGACIRWDLDVPVGPVAQKPGSRLKGPKK